MTDFDKVKVTVALTAMDMPGMARHLHRQNMMKGHGEAADEITVLVPPGTGREARDRIWKALGTAPSQSAREFELMQATAHDDNIRRMFVGP